MITLIYGEKGTGKTKRMIEAANHASLSAKGDVVYVTDNGKHSLEIKHTVRFVNSKEYGICGYEAALGFIKGLLSVNNDIVLIFIDGLARMANTEIENMQGFYEALEALSHSDKADFVLTVSRDAKAMPKFMKKYI